MIAYILFFTIIRQESIKIYWNISFYKMYNQKTNSDVESNIPEMVKHFAEICEKFDNALKKSDKIQNLF